MKYNYSQYFLMCLIFMLSLFAVPLWAAIETGVKIYYIVVPLIFIIQFVLLSRYKAIQPLLLLSLYLFLYFLYLLPYFYFGIRLSQYTLYNKYDYFNKILFIFYLFYLGLLMSSIKSVNLQKNRLVDLITIKPNSGISTLVLCVVIVALMFLFKQGKSVIGSSSAYSVYTQNLEEGNSLGLYILLVLFYLFFLIKKKRRTIVMAFLFLVFAYYCISRGFRMVLAPMLMLAFILFFELRWKTIILVGITFLGFVLLIMVNSIKMNNLLSLNFHTMFNDNSSKDFIIAHHADILYGGASALGGVKEGNITILHRLLLSIGLVTEAIIPPSFLPAVMKYPHIIGMYTRIGGGGLALLGAYLMWGYIGVVVFGFVLGKFIGKAYSSGSGVHCIIVMTILVYFPRWISYDFHVLLRFSFYAFLMYCTLNIAKYLKMNARHS